MFFFRKRRFVSWLNFHIRNLLIFQKTLLKICSSIWYFRRLTRRGFWDEMLAVAGTISMCSCTAVPEPTSAERKRPSLRALRGSRASPGEIVHHAIVTVLMVFDMAHIRNILVLILIYDCSCCGSGMKYFPIRIWFFLSFWLLNLGVDTG